MHTKLHGNILKMRKQLTHKFAMYILREQSQKNFHEIRTLVTHSLKHISQYKIGLSSLVNNLFADLKVQ